MIQDRLLIGDDKTEFLLVGTSITVSNNRISPSPSVKNLVSWFDSNLSMTDHTLLKKYRTMDSLTTLVQGFITSRVHYWNGLLFGLPKAQIAKLQCVQNAAARLILGSISTI